MLRVSLFKFLRTIAVVLSLAAVSYAQTFTLQGGNFQVAGVPVANGSIILTLSNPSATLCVGGGPSTPTYTINLDSNGNMPLTQVIGNSALCPQGTFYTAQLFSGANGTGSLINTSTWPVGPSAPYSGTLYPNVMVLPAVSFTGGVTIPSATVAFSATPTFNAATVSKFYITLTGNVTSSTLTGSVKDQLVIFAISQDGVGGRTFVWPTNVKGQSIATGAGQTSTQAFTSDGTNLWPIGEMTVSSGTTDARANNVTDTGTLAVAGASALANVTLNNANTGTGAALTVGGTSSTTGGISVFVGPFGSQNERAAIVPADGSTAAFRVGSLSVRLISGGFLTGNQVAGIGPTGALSLSTTTGTLPATIANDTAGGILFTNNAGGSMQFGNGGTLFLNQPQGIRWTGATSGNTVVQAAAVAGSGILTLPATVTDTLACLACTQTFSGKTFSDTLFIKRLRATQGTALVAGDFALSAGWGTTASVGSVLGTDSAFSFVVTSSGTGQGVGPTVTITFHDGTWTNSPLCVANMGPGNSGLTAWIISSVSATQLVLQGTLVSGNFTPIAANTYGGTVICVGR